MVSFMMLFIFSLNIYDLSSLGCLQRLDDPSSGIRILAASVITKLEPTFGEEDVKTIGDENQKTVFEHDVWLAFVKHCLNLMFLHYDGPEIRLQEAIKGNTIYCIFSECDC